MTSIILQDDVTGEAYGMFGKGETHTNFRLVIMGVRSISKDLGVDGGTRK